MDSLLLSHNMLIVLLVTLLQLLQVGHTYDQSTLQNCKKVLSMQIYGSPKDQIQDTDTQDYTDIMVRSHCRATMELSSPTQLSHWSDTHNYKTVTSIQGIFKSLVQNLHYTVWINCCLKNVIYVKMSWLNNLRKNDMTNKTLLFFKPVCFQKQSVWMFHT